MRPEGKNILEYTEEKHWTWDMKTKHINTYREIDTDTGKQDHVRKITEKMHAKMITVLAEGVETKEEYDCLKDMNIDFYQGYYLGRPE